MTNQHLRKQILAIFESVDWTKERLKERLKLFRAVENKLKGTDYIFSPHTKQHVEMLEKLTND